MVFSGLPMVFKLPRRIHEILQSSASPSWYLRCAHSPLRLASAVTSVIVALKYPSCQPANESE